MEAKSPVWKKKPTRRARQLRQTLTDAERILWNQLRDRRVASRKFRRQYPIGPYVLDFVCLEERLAIEVDGGQHADSTEEDAQRTAWLEREGFRVTRFWNTDVLNNMEGVLQAIMSEIFGDGAHPGPLPQAGEGEQVAGPPDLRTSMNKER